MHRLPGLAAGLLTTGTLLLTAVFAQQGAAPETRQGEALAPLSHVERFDGRTTLQIKGGKSRDLHVVVQDWGIHGRKPVEKFPEEGFMMVHLLAGKVTTVIDGKEQTHKGGDFWTVSPGSNMSVQVTSESASLQTLAVRQN
jgi:quercetin dioxygenase-like cupin family protein